MAKTLFLDLSIPVDRQTNKNNGPIPTSAGIFIYFIGPEPAYIGMATNLKQKLKHGCPDSYTCWGFMELPKHKVEPIYTLLKENIPGLEKTKPLDTIVGRKTPAVNDELTTNIKQLIKEGVGIVKLGRIKYIKAADLEGPLSNTSTPFGSNHIGRALRAMGYKPIKKNINGTVHRVWTK